MQQRLTASNAGAQDRFGVSPAISDNGETLAIGAYWEDSDAQGVNGPDNNNLSKSGAVYVFTRQGTTWTETAYIKASNTDSQDVFGGTITLSPNGNTMFVSALGEASGNGNPDDNSAAGAGAVYVFRRDNNVWAQTAYLKAPFPDAGDEFGSGLAVSPDGNLLVVGSSGDDSGASGLNGDQTDNGTPNAGAVHIFDQTSGTWEHRTYLKPEFPQEDSFFGGRVALAADARLLAVRVGGDRSGSRGINGDPQDDRAPGSGAVYVFHRFAGEWTGPAAYLKASNSDAGDAFGVDLDWSADGSMLVVGASEEGSRATEWNGDQGDNGSGDSGAVYVFE